MSLRSTLTGLTLALSGCEARTEWHAPLPLPQAADQVAGDPLVRLDLGRDDGAARFTALSAEDGLLVYTEGAPLRRYTLELQTEDGWRILGDLAGAGWWVGPPLDGTVVLRASTHDPEQAPVVLHAPAVALDLSGPSDASALFAGESGELRLSAARMQEDLPLGEVALTVRLRQGEETLYLPLGCHDAGCWTETPSQATRLASLGDLEEAVTLAWETPDVGLGTASVDVIATVVLDGVVLRVASASQAVRLLGGRWAWGDPHAHSGWSNDGCEDPDLGCMPRGDLPGSDFYTQAADNGLDFAAMTDHAEWDWYWPEGDGGDPFPVWDGAAGVVADAMGGVTLPLLGLEWTRTLATAGGTHRTVVFADPSACEAYRVHGRSEAATSWSPSSSGYLFTADDTDSATSVAGLWEALDAAGTTCGEAVRWLTFAHHSAYMTPQETLWTEAANAPTREHVVEIYSEHGSSECQDVTTEGCDFGVNTEQGYVPEGSVQAALQLGFALGFVAGTDGHDARPGSLSDGASPVAFWEDTDGDGLLESVVHQFGAGGLTGALVPRGDLSADLLLDALEARHTVATSGPRPNLRAYAEAPDGTLYLPGDVLPAGDTYALVVDVDSPTDDATGDTLIRVERVGSDLLLADVVTAESFRSTWVPAVGDWTYVRLRYQTPDGAEARVWVSPWFAE